MTGSLAIGSTPQERFLRSYNPALAGDDMGSNMDPDLGYEASYARKANYQGTRGFQGYQGYNGVNNQGYQQSYQGGYGVGPKKAGETQEAYNKRIEDFEDSQFERQIQLQLRNQNATSRMSAPQDIVFDKVDILASQIKRGEQDKIAPAFDALVKVIKDKYMVNGKPPKGMTDAKLTEMAKVEAKRTYSQMTGTSLTDHIDAEGSNSFWQGMKQVLSFGLADKNSAADNIAHVEGDTVNKSSKFAKILGGFSVAGIVGAAVVAFLKGKIKLKP